MAEGYLHVEVKAAQRAKNPASACGDFIRYERTASSTTIACCDGIGTGINANVAAVMCAARLFELIRTGFSLREAFASVAQTMTDAMGADLPFTAFSVARIMSDGRSTVLAYEAPKPILVGRRQAQPLQQRQFTLGRAVLGESHCHLEQGEGILLMSDGIVHAGLGGGRAKGWTTEEICRYVSEKRTERFASDALAEVVLRKAGEYWGAKQGDDCSVAFAGCRKGKVVTLLSGPPAVRENDCDVTRRFLQAEGSKAVCGGTTASILARATGRSLKVVENEDNMIAPPLFTLDGVDVVTEGAVTLNQVFNLLERGYKEHSGASGVACLFRELMRADRVHFMIGGARNEASHHISFHQQRVLPRETIIPLLADKLRSIGKLVVLESV